MWLLFQGSPQSCKAPLLLLCAHPDLSSCGLFLLTTGITESPASGEGPGGGSLYGTFCRTGLSNSSNNCSVLSGSWLDYLSNHCLPPCPPADHLVFQAQPSATRTKNVQSCSFLRWPHQYAFFQHKSLFSVQDVIYCLKSLAWSTPLFFLVHGYAAQGVETP